MFETSETIEVFFFFSPLFTCDSDDRLSLNFHRFVFSFILGHTRCGYWFLRINSVLSMCFKGPKELVLIYYFIIIIIILVLYHTPRGESKHLVYFFFLQGMRSYVLKF